MYYSNIMNKELKYFHNRPVHNFTVKLSQMLTSDLFQVEEIITDSIYKIYPLFYTGTIISSNPNDRILDNKVIICQKLESTEEYSQETFFTFISDETQDIIDYSEYGTYYEIGDQLTESQYNAYISLLRQNVRHTGDFRISQGELKGSYGTYEFEISNATIIDNGIVITDETITAQPKVKLTDNVFRWSSYILKLNIIHYTGVNILDDTTSDFKVVDTLEIELTPNEWVNIPVEDLEEDYIISFNATVTINHNKNIIRGMVIRLFDLVSDKNIVQNGEVYNLSVKAWDSVAGVEGQSVEFLQFNPLLFYFEGRGGFEVDNWQYNHSALTVTSDDTGTTVANSSGTRRIYWANINPTSTSDSEYDSFNDITVDFDLISCTGGYFILRTSDGGTTGAYNKTLTNVTGHIQFKMVNGVMEYYLDGVLVDSASVDDSSYQVAFYVYDNSTLKFKNLIIGGY